MLNGQTADRISIYDINGKLMLSQPINNEMGILNINVSSLTSGNYIVTFGKDGINGTSTKFLVK